MVFMGTQYVFQQQLSPQGACSTCALHTERTLVPNETQSTITASRVCLPALYAGDPRKLQVRVVIILSRGTFLPITHDTGLYSEKRNASNGVPALLDVKKLCNACKIVHFGSSPPGHDNPRVGDPQWGRGFLRKKPKAGPG